MKEEKHILWFNEITKEDVGLVGGKNANLGEMYQKLTDLGVRVPNGFAVTTKAYDYFIKSNNLEEKIKEILQNLDVYNVEKLQKAGETIRNFIKQGEFPEDLKKEILDAFEKLKKEYGENLQVAVRSSASAEDLPQASFAGQQETYLNVTEKDLLEKIKYCFASLFTDRAIFYRQEKGFDHFEVKLSAGVQKMVRSDLASSGVMFTIDTDSGLNKVIVINGVWGLGELIVQGKVIPDEWIVFKEGLEKGFRSIISKMLGEKVRKIVYAEKGGVKEVETSQEERDNYSLNDEEVLELAKMGIIIERHYQRAMDIEWAKDGIDGKLYIVQARAETVHSTKKYNVYEEYRLNPRQSDFDPHQSVVLKGIAIGSKITSGRVRVIKDVSKINEFQEGEILVTEMTDPDWVVALKKAKGVITDKGGRTCFEGDTKILTNKGFMKIKDVVEKVNRGENLYSLSFDMRTYKLVWRKITEGFKRISAVKKIIIGNKNNYLISTPDHRFFTLFNRKLVKRAIESIIESKEGVLSFIKIPRCLDNFDGLVERYELSNEKMYLLGSILSDGSIQKNKQGGYIISFFQKINQDKINYINFYKTNFERIFKKSLHQIIDKRNSVISLCIYSKDVFNELSLLKSQLPTILLGADIENLKYFLAGVMDGDGNISSHQIQITVGINNNILLESLIITLLRLGFVFNLHKHKRGSYYVISIDKKYGDEIVKYTHRLSNNTCQNETYQISKKINIQQRFIAKQIIGDILDLVNKRGQIKYDYFERNNKISDYKIKNFILPIISKIYKDIEYELRLLLESGINMKNVKFSDDENASLNYKKSEVYNISIEAIHDMDHNYIVFSSKYTPVLVANCHAAIVSRELGIPAIVGTQKATEILKTGDKVTIDCSTGITGYVYKGILDYEVIEHNLEKLPETKTKIYVNIGLPDEAWEKWYLPVKGVGLAREEFIIAEEIKIHPNALINYSSLSEEIKQKIDEFTQGYEDKKQYFIDKLAEGIAKICVAYWPYEVIVRFSDFKTNEYRNLIGGELYEPNEENPMIGWRGASRYYHPKFKQAFELEVLAMKKVREEMGITNLTMMVPFCRTPEEGRRVMEIIENVLGPRKEKGYKVYVMCEIPSNILQADEFLEIFDGMSIGSNDLTQLTLGIDRDNEILQGLADERNESVKKLIAEVIKKCKEKGKYVGICGQAPSDFPEIVEFLVKEGIESISVNSDVVIKTIEMVKKFEDENR
ncbi:Phosphoenolpyruvate synthase [bacterium HR35]|nr:Phosphoenolpyruvate synthase [bacterium HR35]